MYFLAKMVLTQQVVSSFDDQYKNFYSLHQAFCGGLVFLCSILLENCSMNKLFSENVQYLAAAVAGAFFLAVIVLAVRQPGFSQPAAKQEVLEVKNDEPGVAVLLFHAVDKDSDNPNALNLKDLEATFQALKDSHYKPISLEEFHAFIDGRSGVPKKAVLITFDDGYRDIYETVLPLTKKFRFPAVVFTIDKWFDPYPRTENSRRHLNVEEAGELLKYGWSIGGHSYDGHRLVPAGHNAQGPFYVTRMWLENERRFETDAEYKARVWSDISLDRVALKRAGVSEPVDFAFPYGAFNTDVVNMLNEAGYTYLYMDKPGLNRRGQDPSYICRITAGRSSHETMALLGWHFSQNR